MLDIRLIPSNKDSVQSAAQILYVSPAMAMNEEQKQEWTTVCSCFPPSLQELDIHGFSWADAAEGLKAASLPNLRCLDLHLYESAPDMRTSSVFANFPKVNDLTLPATWCPSSAWFAEVIADRVIERFGLGLADPIPGRHLEAWKPEKHTCEAKECVWYTSICQTLLKLAPTLSMLLLGTPTIVYAKLPTGAFTSLTSLHINFVPFYDENELEAVFMPFLASPLVHLELTQCGDIPEEFAGWFNPRSKKKWPNHSQRGPRWPTLKTLTIDGIPAGSIEEGEWKDDPTGLAALKMVFFWCKAPREGLVKYCQARNIELDVEWKWIEDVH